MDLTGTAIHAQATVTFDTGLPDQSSLSTNTFVNTIDAAVPSSSVAPLPAVTTSPSFSVNWTGTDPVGGSGIASYSVFVSDNGGPFSAFEFGTTATSAVFDGQVGHKYTFYSVAESNAGVVQPTPADAQATITLVAPAVIEFAAASIHASESDTSVSTTLSRTGDLTESVSVVVSSPGDSNVPAFSRSMTFQPNQTSKTIVIGIRDDAVVETSDTIATIKLSSPSSNAILGGESQATLAIANTDRSLVRVASVRVESIEVGTRKEGRKLSGIVVGFTCPVEEGVAHSMACPG
jgi:hypothetical protein